MVQCILIYNSLGIHGVCGQTIGAAGEGEHCIIYDYKRKADAIESMNTDIAHLRSHLKAFEHHIVLAEEGYDGMSIVIRKEAPDDKR